MVTQTFTIEEFKVHLDNLPKKLQFAAESINQELAKSVQMGIRIRAIGLLKETRIEKAPKGLKLIGYRHWSYVDAGYFPKFPIPYQAIELHLGNPGSTAGKPLNIPKKDITGWFQPKESSSKGFVSKSITSAEERMPEIINRGLDKAFQK